jgi:hypothetical protein
MYIVKPMNMMNSLIRSGLSLAEIRQAKIVGFVVEFRKVIGDRIVRLIFYWPRPGLQSANPNASVSKKLGIAISNSHFDHETDL